jgi:holo-[acyl-carrier protein] synthase
MQTTPPDQGGSPEHFFTPPANGAGIGIDIVLVERMARRLGDEKFLGRLFHPGELENAGSGPGRAARLAARWAAKEAMAKALGCGFGPELSWADVEVFRQESGQPLLKLSGRAMKRHGNPVTALSMSHDGDYAVAVVWILSRESGEESA